MSTPQERYTPGASSSTADVEFCECCGEIVCPCCRKPIWTRCCDTMVCLFCALDNRGKPCKFCGEPPSKPAVPAIKIAS